MSAERRVLSPIVASALAGAVVVSAALGGTIASERSTHKEDRFAVVGDDLCQGQVWPNLSDACLAWSGGTSGEATGGYATLAAHEPELQRTTLTRVRHVPTY